MEASPNSAGASSNLLRAEAIQLAQIQLTLRRVGTPAASAIAASLGAHVARIESLSTASTLGGAQ